MEITTAVNQRLLFNKLNLPREAKKIEAFRGSVSESNLSEVKGIGDATKTRLHEAWISTKEQLLEKTEEEIGEIITNPLAQKGVFAFMKLNK